MKKIFSLIGLLLLFPLLVLADGVENYYINATIESDGSLLVEEYFTLSGEYRGYERIIDYKNSSASLFNVNASSYGGSTAHNGSGLEIIEIGGANTYFNGDFATLEVDTFKYNANAKKGDYGLYNYDTTSTGKDIMIYNPSAKNKAFYLKYRLNNMAILFNDVGEIGWNVIGNEFREDIDNLVVTLNVPNNSGELKAWAHGPLNGFIKLDSNEKATFTITNLSSYTSIDIRSTFSPSIIANSPKKYNVDALDKILAYENAKAEEANELRRQNEANNETNAKKYLDDFKNNITRENYTKAYNAINILMDGTTKTNLLEELNVYKDKLDKIEEEYALDCLNTLEKKLSMNNYDEALNAIDVLDEENIKENYQNRLATLYQKLERKERMDNVFRFVGAFSLGVIVIYLITVIYKKYKKDPEVEFNAEYLREIPSDATPEDVSYLFNRSISDNAMSASIMDLIRRKVITQEKINDKNYKLTLNKNIEVNEKDKKLLKVIFGDTEEITTKKMKLNANILYEWIIDYYNKYMNTAKSNAIEKGYYESDVADIKEAKTKSKTQAGKIVVIIIFFYLSIVFPPLFIVWIIILFGYLLSKFIKCLKSDFTKGIIIGSLVGLALISTLMSIYIVCANLMYKSAILGYLLLLLLIICVGVWYSIPTKRTKEGALEYKKWKALEKFLKDFGSFADKEVPEIALWEKYLVYATLFGCAKEVSKVMDMRIKEYNMSGLDYYDSWATSYYINNLISNSIHSTVASAKSAKYAHDAASSSSSSGSWSSGSGGGGGFSSGGGSFGGGGGGGRF